MITLYDCTTAPSPRRARIFLAEKGIAHETVQVDLRNSEQLSSAYQKINPQCTVPALRIEDGAMLTDNAAITAYLEARYPEPPLLGTTPNEKAEIADVPSSCRADEPAPDSDPGASMQLGPWIADRVRNDRPRKVVLL